MCIERGFINELFLDLPDKRIGSLPYLEGLDPAGLRSGE